ncbi:CLUMA_CG010775, isoform A [Clunio marinus]|uniref:CLUMA_CG010775, isoform A n=1 Tax=Clunio marinus TaxID=568069 RepID=A0A1J1IG10_9DIPT|nr:CLUMA_CG010775, isoform A [Clunio marinus]
MLSHLMETLLLLLIASSRNVESSTGNVAGNNALNEDPEFTDIIENITVPAGRNVKLACSVKNLGSYKVAWMHFEQSAILTVHNHVITRNPRISVTHDKHDKHKTWFLHIANVQEEDKGRYMCQINTVTAKTQFGYLHVVVPPNIDDAHTSTDVVVREGANVTLRCRANGSPPPTIRWKRDDNMKININRSLAVSEWENETLEMTKVSRLDIAAFLCIASNGIPPSVSKRIKLSIDFPPMLIVPHQLVGIPLAFNATLECVVEAHPTSLNYWCRENEKMIYDSQKYKTETLVSSPSYKSIMRLTIYNIQHSDFGIYKCVAKNPRGETESSIRLYSSQPPTTIPPPTTEVIETTSTKKVVNYLPPVGQTTVYTVHMIDKGSKYQASINEIENSEQKLTDSAKSVDWSGDIDKTNKVHEQL